MTRLRLRPFGQTDEHIITVSGEFEDELMAQVIEAIRNSHISIPAAFEDLHVLCWSDELGQWVEV